MKPDLNYDQSAHRFGRVSLICGLLGTMIFPLLLILVFRVQVNGSDLLAGIGSILLLMLPVSISEFLSVAPMIGSSAMYLMVLTGNFTNLKIPSSIAAMEAVGLDPANYTDESDVISTIAMGVSTLVSELIIIIGVILLVPLARPLSSPALAPAFANIVPALFGALGTGMMMKNFRLALAPLAVGVLLFVTGIVPAALIMPVLILIGVVVSRILYRHQLLK